MSSEKKPARFEKGRPEAGTVVFKRRWGGTVSLALGLLCLGLYANALPNPFIFDDLPLVQHDSRVRDFEFGRIWTEQYWGEGHRDKLYRPLITLSLALNWLLSDQPWTFRLVNLALHAACCILVFHLMRALFDDFRAAILGAGLFAIHPIHTEPLNTIIGRADIAVTALTLAAALLWWRDGQRCLGGAASQPGLSPREPNREGSRSGTHEARVWQPILAAVCFAAATLCKESGVTLPGMILLLDWWFWQRRRPLRRTWWRRRVFRCYLPIMLVLLGYLAARQVVLGQLTSGAVVKRTENPINLPADMLGAEDSKFLVRWATPLYTFAKASCMMAWPWPLIHDYSIPALPAIRRFGDPRLWVGVGWLAVFLIILARSYVRNRKLLVAVALALVPYSIVSNFVIIIGTIFGERLLYAPSVGACMALGLVLSPALSRHRAIIAREQSAEGGRPSGSRAALAVAVILVLATVAYGYSVVRRNRDWRSPEALVLSVGDHERTSFKVLGAFAEMALKEGHRHLAEGDEAAAQAAYRRSLDYARRGLEIAPDTWGPHSAYGLALSHLGENKEALKVLARALQKGAAYDPRTLFAAGHLMVEVEGDYATAIPHHWFA
jgi:hypothetical protein